MLVPLIRTVTGSNGFGLLAAGVVLSVMILPTVITLSEDALRAVPGSLREGSLAMGATRWQTIWNVLLPATIPEVIAGLRIGFTVTLLGVLLAEMFASKDGLGFLIINAMTLLQAKEMISIAVVLFAFAAVANAILLWIEHRLHHRA